MNESKTPEKEPYALWMLGALFLLVLSCVPLLIILVTVIDTDSPNGFFYLIGGGVFGPFIAAAVVGGIFQLHENFRSKRRTFQVWLFTGAVILGTSIGLIERQVNKEIEAAKAESAESGSPAENRSE